MVEIQNHDDYVDVTATFYYRHTSKGQDKFVLMPRAMRWRGRDIVFKSLNAAIPTKKGERWLHRIYANDGENTYGLEFDAQLKGWKVKETLSGLEKEKGLEEYLADERYTNELN